MNKNTPCQCTSECQIRRCSCLKTGHACTAGCRCENCKNPFNNRDPEEYLSDCARYHIKKVASLTPQNLKKKYALPCGCGQTIFQNLGMVQITHVLVNTRRAGFCPDVLSFRHECYDSIAL